MLMRVKHNLRNIIFIDAIIFTYLLTGHPTYGRSCQKLLEKVEGGTIEAFISPLVIDEVSYVLMVQTARRTGSPNDARSMKKAEPFPTRLSTRMLPPMSSTSCLVMAMPRPVPL